MFPNVRLLLVALSAAVVTLTCGLAVFAAFGVNHEPFGRLSAGTAPFRFAAEHTTGTATLMAWGTPLGSRFQSGTAQIGSIAAAAPSLGPDSGAAPAAPLHPGSNNAASEEPAAPSALAPTAARGTPVPDTDSGPTVGGAPLGAFAAHAPEQDLPAPRDSRHNEPAGKTDESASAEARHLVTTEPPADQVQVKRPVAAVGAIPAAAARAQATPKVRRPAKARRSTTEKTSRKAVRRTVRKAVKRQRAAAKRIIPSQRRRDFAGTSNEQNSSFWQATFQNAPNYFQNQPAGIAGIANKATKTTPISDAHLRPPTIKAVSDSRVRHRKISKRSSMKLN